MLVAIKQPPRGAGATMRQWLSAEMWDPMTAVITAGIVIPAVIFLVFILGKTVVQLYKSWRYGTPFSEDRPWFLPDKPVAKISTRKTGGVNWNLWVSYGDFRDAVEFGKPKPPDYWSEGPYCLKCGKRIDWPKNTVSWECGDCGLTTPVPGWMQRSRSFVKIAKILAPAWEARRRYQKSKRKKK